MDALRSLVQPLVGGGGNSSIIDGVKLVVLGTTVETARRVSSSAWSHFVNSFFLTAHFSEEDYPYDWLMLWLSRRPEWQRSREFETTTRSSAGGPGGRIADNSFGDEDAEDGSVDTDDVPGKVRTRVVFQPTMDTTHTIYYRGHWLRVKRSRQSGCDTISISVVARSNSILKQLVLQAKREYEAEAIHRIQIYFADLHGSWRWTDSRHKRPLTSIVLGPGVKETLLSDTKDFLNSEKWYADRGIPFRRGYLLHGVPGSGKSSLIHAIAGELALDIYVVSLSSSWISDSTLTTLMGRVPARCIVLLEDLDAAFTRSVSRDSESTGAPGGTAANTTSGGQHGPEPASSRRRSKEPISDVNTLSLSGLLNALDGVAASEGRLLFATTNHLERLDPALSRPGRMDVWIEFKNASQWQAEQLFRNFFPSSDAAVQDEDVPIDEITLEKELAGVEIRTTMPNGDEFEPSCATPEIPSLNTSQSSSSLSSIPSQRSSTSATTLGTSPGTSVDSKVSLSEEKRSRLEREHEIRHTAVPLSARRLSDLARQFTQSIPDEEFSVASLQGYLLKNKTRPEEAAEGASAWVQTERDLREKLKREKDKAAKEAKEKSEAEDKKRKEEAKAAEGKAKTTVADSSSSSASSTEASKVVDPKDSDSDSDSEDEAGQNPLPTLAASQDQTNGDGWAAVKSASGWN